MCDAVRDLIVDEAENSVLTAHWVAVSLWRTVV